MAAKMRKDDLVTLSSFGDGATSSSEFHVGMNFAGVYKAPTIFLCENNQYAISVPLTQQTASATIAVKARAYGFEGIRIDGNDLFAVYSTVRKAAESARRGEGPTLIECYTYRLGAHSTADDWKRYRSNEEVESWKRKDPILRVRAYLEDTRKVWSDDKETKLRAEIEGTINAAITKGESIPPPAIETMFEDVYAELTTNLKEQKEDLLSSSQIIEKDPCRPFRIHFSFSFVVSSLSAAGQLSSSLFEAPDLIVIGCPSLIPIESRSCFGIVILP